MNNKKNVLLIVLAVGVVAMTVAFAALSTTLRISGTASVPSTTWNIHFQNWALDTALTVTEGGITHQNTAEYPSISQLSQTLSPNITKVDNLNVTLYQPGDYAKYTFQIINEGTIDASLDTFTHNLTCATGNDCSHLSYTIECVDSQNNNVLTTHSLLPKNGGLAYCTLQVKYLDQTNQNSNSAGSNQVYTQAAAHANLDATWIYIQKVDSQANSGSDSGGNGGSPLASYTYYGYGTMSEDPTGYDLDYEDYQEPGNNNTCPSGYAYDEGYDEYVAGCYYINDGYCDNGYYNSDTGKCEYDEYGELQDVSEKDVYIRDDGEIKEVCKVFPSGTVCIAPIANGYSSDFENFNSGTYTLANIDESGLKGYTLAKMNEMISKGATYCTVDGEGYVDCYVSNDFYCGISPIDSVYCSNGSVSCYTDSGEHYGCD